jgi:hypothetical protein
MNAMEPAVSGAISTPASAHEALADRFLARVATLTPAQWGALDAIAQRELNRVTVLDDDPFSDPVELQDVIDAARRLQPAADADWS